MGGPTFQIEEDDWNDDDAFFSGVDPDALAATHRQQQQQQQPLPAWNQYRQGVGAHGHAAERARPHPHGVGGLLDGLPSRSRGGGGRGVGGGGGGGRFSAAGGGGGFRGGFTVDPLDAWNVDRGGFASSPADEEDDMGSEEEEEDSDGGGAGSPIEYVDLVSPPPPLRERKGLGEALGDGTRWVDGARGAWGQQPLRLQPQRPQQRQQQPQRQQQHPAAAVCQQSPYQREFEKQQKKQGKSWTTQRQQQQHANKDSNNAGDILASIGAGGPTHRPWKKAGGGGVPSTGGGGGGARGGGFAAAAFGNFAYDSGDEGEQRDDVRSLSYGAAWSRERAAVLGAGAAAARAGAKSSDRFAAADAKYADRERDEAMRERATLAEKREAERAAAKAAREERAAERLRSRVIDLDYEDGSAASAAAAVAAVATAAAAAEAERRKRLVSMPATAATAGASARALAARQRVRSATMHNAPLSQPPWTPPKLEDVVGAVLRWSMAYIKSTRQEQDRKGKRRGDDDDENDDDHRRNTAVDATMKGGTGRHGAPKTAETTTPGAAAGPPPSTFSSAQQYVEFFAPLLLAELRAQAASSVEEAGGVVPGVPVPAVVDSLVGREGIFHVVRIGLGRSAPGDAFQENDLVVIEKQQTTGATGATGAMGAMGATETAGTTIPHHALGWVEAIETGPGAWSGTGGGRAPSDGGSGVRLRVRTCLVDHPGGTVRWLAGGSGDSLNHGRERERRDGILRVLLRQATAVRLSRLLSLTPPLREMQALLHFSKMPLYRTILAPAKTTAKKPSAGDSSVEAPEGVSADLWKALTADLNPPQRAAVAAVSSAGHYGALPGGCGSRVVLIQGPPGTGKTHTIASAVAVILSANGGDGKNNINNSGKDNNENDDNDKGNRHAQTSRGRGGRAGDVREASGGGGGHGTGHQRLKRVLVCAQSNSAVDELVARLARTSVPRAGGASHRGMCSSSSSRGGGGGGGGQRISSIESTVPSLVRLGRDEVVRQDALPFLVSRLVDDCAAAARVAAAAAAAAESRENNTKKTNDTTSEKMSFIQARLDRLGEEIIAGTAAAEGASRDATSSIHLDMLHAQRRRLLGELAAARQERRNERVDLKASAGSTWSQVVGGAEIVCATLSGAGLLAADRTGGGRGGGRGAGGGGGGFGACNANVKAAAAANGLGLGLGGTVATTDEGESMMLAAGSSVPLFDAVVIDEAAQATEPATLIPLRWLRPGGAVVLVGDPRQLAPTVLSRGHAARRLSRSMFERLQTAGARVHLLSVQYRMHPEIRAFPSDRFYGGALVDGRAAADRHAAHHLNVSNCGPYVAFDVAGGVERRGPRTASLSNAAEADLAAAVYAQLQKSAAAAAAAAAASLASRSDGDGESPSESPPPVMTVGVVTPYRDQMSELKRRFANLLAHADARFAPVVFATVDGVQGREFDAVILSCVRAPTRAGGGAGAGRFDQQRQRRQRDTRHADGGASGWCLELNDESAASDREDAATSAEDAAHSRRTIGFLGDPRRLNVALTRPRRTLVVLGHAATLRSADRLWASLWDDADRRGLAVRAEQPFANLFVSSGGGSSRGFNDGAHQRSGIKRRSPSPPPRVAARVPRALRPPPPPPPAPPAETAPVNPRRQCTIDLTVDDDDVDDDPPSEHRPKKRAKGAAQGAAGLRASRGDEAPWDDSALPSVASPCTAEELTRLVRAAVVAAGRSKAGATPGATAGAGAGLTRDGASVPVSEGKDGAIDALAALERTVVTVALLAETQAGRTVKKLSKQPGVDEDVAAAASAVVSAWKQLVMS